MAEFFISTGKILLAVAVGLPLVLYFLQDRLIFYPQPMAEAQRAAVERQFPSAKSIFLNGSDGTRLHAWQVPAAAGAPLVIYFGGNAEDVSWMLEETARNAPGVGWLLVDYRGYGGSEGSPSEAAISSDALQWYDYAASEIRPAEVIAFGRSLGSGAAVYLASQRKLKSVILVSPFDSLVAVAARYYPFLPVQWMLKHRFDSAALAPKLTVPLLCLAAMRDEVIPPAHAKALYEAWAGPKRWVALEEAGHNTTDSHPLFWHNIAGFLQKPST